LLGKQFKTLIKTHKRYQSKKQSLIKTGMRRRPGIGGLQTAAAARVTTVSSVGLLIHRFPFGYLLMLNINSF